MMLKGPSIKGVLIRGLIRGVPLTTLPPSIYRFSTMMMCWAADPKDRPTFESLATNLAQSLAAMADYLTLGQDLEACLTTAGNNQKESSPRYVCNPTLTPGQCLDGGYVDVNFDTPKRTNTGSRGRKASSKSNRNNSYASSEVMASEDLLSPMSLNGVELNITSDVVIEN